MRDKEVIEVLLSSPAFKGLSAERIEKILNELSARRKRFDEGAYIAHQGDALDKFPIVLSGMVEASIPSIDRSQIVGRFGVGESFAEAVPTTLHVSPVEIKTLEESDILFIPASRLMQTNTVDGLLVRANIMAEMSKKIAELSIKLMLLAEPRLRRRIELYLERLDADADGWIRLSFNRRELASFLGVNDKSLTRELHRMQDEGLIELSGRKVRLLKQDK